MKESDLSATLKTRLSKLVYNIDGDVLTANDNNYLQYNSDNSNWQTVQQIVVTHIDGTKTVIASTGYTANLTSGYITLNSAILSTDVVTADYSFSPFSDDDLLSILRSAEKQVQTLIYRPVICPLGYSGFSGFSGCPGFVSSGYSGYYILDNYAEAILKKSYTIALREMQFPTIRYFSISVGGRQISKEKQVEMIEVIIKSNEEEVIKDINAIRNFDKTNVLM